MTKRYTHDDYSPDVLPNGLHRDVVDLITDAVMEMGWTVEVKHIRAILRAAAPNEKQSIPFSASAPPGNLNSIRRKITKYADPEIAKQRTKAKREAALRKEAEVKGEVQLAGERAVENKKPDESPTIVKSEPLMVSNRKGTAVASDSTLVRTWSDGKVDYACAVPGCDFTSESKYGPGRGHRKGHVLKGEVKAAKYSKNYQPEEAVVTVRNEASEALAEALKVAINEGVDWSDLDGAVVGLAERATALLPKPEKAEPEPSEPSPAEGVLDQIRELVGGVAPDRVAELESELAAVRSERDRLVSERAALRDLLTDSKEAAS